VNFLRHITYSNVVVSLSATALTASTFFYETKVDVYYLLLVFFATLFVYTYARFFEGESVDYQNSEITKWHKSHRRWVWFIVVFSVLASIVFAYASLTREQWAFGFLLAAISLAYPLGLRFKGVQSTFKPLRESPGIKLLAIAGVWVAVSVVFPLWNQWKWVDLALGLSRFFFILAITIPFDIRDYREDSPQMWTLPMIWGRMRAWQMALISGGLSAVLLMVYGFNNSVPTTLIAGELLGHSYALIWVYRSPKQNQDLYFSFWLEISPIILFSCLYLFSYI